MPLIMMCCFTLWFHFQSLTMSALMKYLCGQGRLCTNVPQHLRYRDLPHVADGRLEGGGQVGRQQEAEGEVVNTLAQSQSRSGFIQSIY